MNLVDAEMMTLMADTGCLELRFGIESGSERILKEIRKGFTTAQVLEVVPRAIEIFPRVDAFFVWGFPFETMEDFQQTLFQMVSLRMMGARILPSLLSLLPQTEIYRDYAGRTELEFLSLSFPRVRVHRPRGMSWRPHRVARRYHEYFDLILDNPDVFPGFYHINLAGNVLPKLAMLRQFGFYPEPQPSAASAESCGAHSPNAPREVLAQELATRAGR